MNDFNHHHGKREPPAQDPDANGPLAGIRILDFTSVILGALATQTLGDMGADVIKVEAPDPESGMDGDIMRWGGQQPEAATPGMGPLFLSYNRNKQSVLLDLKQTKGQQRIRALLAEADVMVSSIRYPAMERLGLDYPAVQAIKSDIIYVHATGFGSDGPYAGLPAYDDLIQAASGTADLLPRTDGDCQPRYLPSLLADKTVGLYLVNAVLGGLFHHQRTGQGQFIEAPMLECFTAFTMSENLYGHVYDPPTQEYGYGRVLNPHRRPYRTADGYLAVVPYNNRQWRDFFQLGARPELAEDQRFKTYQARTENIKALYALVEDITRLKTTAEWLGLLRQYNIPAMPVNRLDQVMDDEHLKAVKMFEKREHPAVGRYINIRHPVKYSASPADAFSLPPVLGEGDDN